ncbi:MAG: hypothetical protein CVT66_08605 [Actinobacteria bacterium HGW-Actinobacteria-6]|nr:MAG: hypothetical protein CVT66_08605 [Actinobacteria bacterium HGW-Actinobacteria-6]
MSTGRTFNGIAALCLALALVAGVTAAIGVFDRGSGETASAVSIRGERFDYATDGIYAFNPERVVAEGVGWDVVTLLFAVPALLLALPALRRGSLGGRLFTVGILAYFFYQYMMYAMFWALGPLFPVFIVLYAAAACAIVWIVSTIDVEGLPARFSAGFPRKGMAVFSVLVALMLLVMWSQRIATGLSGDLAGAALFGMPTLTVQAMDLGMVVPLAIATAVLLFRSKPWGYLLAPVFAVKGVTMAGAICAMLVSAALVEGSLEVVPFVMFAAVALASGALAWRILRSARTV